MYHFDSVDCLLSIIPLSSDTVLDVPTLSTWFSDATIDAVSSPDFRRLLVFTGSAMPTSLSKDVRDYLDQRSIKHAFLPTIPDKCAPGGPYICRNKTLHPVYRLYSDRLGTFMQTLLPNLQSGYMPSLKFLKATDNV